jgi:predicted nucleic acid-binding protein
MKIIVDSNIIFSALLSEENDCQYILYSDDFEFYSCNFMFLEIFKHKEKILEHSDLSIDELLTQFEKILSRITFINEEIVSTNAYYNAFLLCKKVDENDIPFVALSLFMDGYLLTSDKKLYEELRDKGINVFNIPDFLEMMNNPE